MKKAIAIIVSVLFVFALTSLSFAAEEKKAAPAPAAEKKEAAPAEKKAPAKVKQVSGDVAAVDVKAGTITVKGKKADVTVTCDDKTKVTMGKEKKACSDVKAGDKVTVKYTEVDGKNVAKSVSIKPAEKKAEPAKPAEKPAAKPLEKK